MGALTSTLILFLAWLEAELPPQTLLVINAHLGGDCTHRGAILGAFIATLDIQFWQVSKSASWL